VIDHRFVLGTLIPDLHWQALMGCKYKTCF
jgi:hypothetical protein